jgi:hypothetical protein
VNSQGFAWLLAGELGQQRVQQLANDLGKHRLDQMPVEARLSRSQTGVSGKRRSS